MPGISLPLGLDLKVAQFPLGLQAARPEVQTIEQWTDSRCRNVRVNWTVGESGWCGSCGEIGLSAKG